ncbi:MAG TPA: glycine zipper domain-containing protein [Tepidisphaeraceae bacterium]|jgi:uncharacterized protein YcfJ
MRHFTHALACLVTLSPLLATLGCETGRGTGTLAGAGVGGLVGLAAGGTPRGALIGAGVGAMGGYIIGNEMDRAYARGQRERHEVNRSDLQPLMGTTWRLDSITPAAARLHASVVIEFRPDGILRTTRTRDDGRVTTDEEFYRIVNNILIVNDIDYIINGPFILQDRSLTFVVGDVTSRWTRV